MRTFSFRNGTDSLFGLTEYLINHGEPVEPRRQATLELRNVTIQIRHPDDVCFYDINRGWNDRLAAAEALQLIGGFSSPEVMKNIVPRMADFINPETGQFDGAYGVRTASQMPWLIERIQKDPDTRQGVLQIWNASVDLVHGSRDYPCTVYINFSIRNGVLLMTTHMRSNDVWWGWCYDLFQFTQLGWTIANFFGVEMGTYTHVVDSFHLYERDIERVHALKKPAGTVLRLPQRLRGLGVKQQGYEIPTWQQFAQEPAWEFFNDEKNFPLTDTEQWFIDRELWKYRGAE